jgi:hypothetical protein
MGPRFRGDNIRAKNNFGLSCALMLVVGVDLKIFCPGCAAKPLAGPLSGSFTSPPAKIKKGPDKIRTFFDLVAGVGFEPTTFRL